MDEETEEKKPDLVKKISKFLPAVGKPEYKQSLNTRLKWTGIALLCYFVLSYISVYGLSPSSYEQFQLFQIVLGSKMGSLMTLGIGPIVTAGIILQLLVGSKILKWDMTKPEGRSKFQLWDKVLAIAFCFLEGGAYVLAGALPVSGGLPVMIFVILQLAAGGIIVILLDELVSKWGFGSGVSLFIAAGVASQIFIGLFSPLSAQGRIAGAIPGFINSFFAGNMSAGLAYLLPVLTTALVFIIVIYAQGVAIDIPLTFSAIQRQDRARRRSRLDARERRPGIQRLLHELRSERQFVVEDELGHDAPEMQYTVNFTTVTPPASSSCGCAGSGRTGTRTGVPGIDGVQTDIAFSIDFSGSPTWAWSKWRTW